MSEEARAAKATVDRRWFKPIYSPNGELIFGNEEDGTYATRRTPQGGFLVEVREFPNIADVIVNPGNVIAGATTVGPFCKFKGGIGMLNCRVFDSGRLQGDREFVSRMMQSFPALPVIVPMGLEEWGTEEAGGDTKVFFNRCVFQVPWEISRIFKVCNFYLAARRDQTSMEQEYLKQLKQLHNFQWGILLPSSQEAKFPVVIENRIIPVVDLTRLSEILIPVKGGKAPLSQFFGPDGKCLRPGMYEKIINYLAEPAGKGLKAEGITEGQHAIHDGLKAADLPDFGLYHEEDQRGGEKVISAFLPKLEAPLEKMNEVVDALYGEKILSKEQKECLSNMLPCAKRYGAHLMVKTINALQENGRQGLSSQQQAVLRLMDPLAELCGKRSSDQAYLNGSGSLEEELYGFLWNFKCRKQLSEEKQQQEEFAPRGYFSPLDKKEFSSEEAGVLARLWTYNMLFEALVKRDVRFSLIDENRPGSVDGSYALWDFVARKERNWVAGEDNLPESVQIGARITGFVDVRCVDQIDETAQVTGVIYGAESRIGKWARVHVLEQPVMNLQVGVGGEVVLGVGADACLDGAIVLPGKKIHLDSEDTTNCVNICFTESKGPGDELKGCYNLGADLFSTLEGKAAMELGRIEASVSSAQAEARKEALAKCPSGIEEEARKKLISRAEDQAGKEKEAENKKEAQAARKIWNKINNARNDFGRYGDYLRVTVGDLLPQGEEAMRQLEQEGGGRYLALCAEAYISRGREVYEDCLKEIRREGMDMEDPAVQTRIGTKIAMALELEKEKIQQTGCPPPNVETMDREYERIEIAKDHILGDEGKVRTAIKELDVKLDVHGGGAHGEVEVVKVMEREGVEEDWLLPQPSIIPQEGDIIEKKGEELPDWLETGDSSSFFNERR
ncbi:MAG: hypothetical protein V1746_05415 [bacterium]